MQKTSDLGEKIDNAKANASSSIILARAVLGDAELGRILSKYAGRPNTPEIRALMVKDVTDHLQAHMATTLHGGVPGKRRTYSLRTWLGKRLDTFQAVLDYGPGGFMFDERGDLIIHTPDGSLITWNVTRPDVEPFWVWDGDRDHPNLFPPMCITQDEPDGSVRELWQGRMVGGNLVPV